MDNGASSYRRFLDGDEEGMVEIVRDYKDGLILYLHSFVGDLHLAEELAEDAFVKLGTRRPRDRGKAAFKTWLYTIGRNLAIDHLRRNSRNPGVSLETLPEITGEEMDLEAACIREEGKITLHRAMGRLKPEYRQILWLIYFENFSCKEAAVVMRKTVHGIETLAYRARQALKAQLEKEGFMYEGL